MEERCGIFFNFYSISVERGREKRKKGRGWEMGKGGRELG